jgi:GT2 family glycosyltransferase
MPPAPEETPGGGFWPKVSIVTPSFNQGQYIEQTIRSVLLQNYPSLEYIIIDGGSTDDTVSTIRKYERWLAYWVSEADRGAEDAVRKGFAKATGELYGIMCADDYYIPGGVSMLAGLRFEHPKSVAYVGGIATFDDDGLVLDEFLPYIQDQQSIGDNGNTSRIPGIACFFDAAAYHRVGEFDPRFAPTSDYELWVKLAKLGTFETLEKIVAMNRWDPHSLSRRDWPEMVAAGIALNYYHGHRDVAKTILDRYTANEGLKILTAKGLMTLTASQACSVIPADELVRAMGLPVLAMAVLRHTAQALKRRIVRAIRGRSQ